MFRRMLVPLDGSDAAEIVLHYVLQLAARSGAQVVLVSVSETRLGDADVRNLYGSYLGQITDRVKRGLQELGAGAVEVRNEVLVGRPASEILSYADFINADLIVMASRGASGGGPWLLGNVAAKVLRATGRPTLLVRTGQSRPGAEMRPVKRILVPLDGSPIGATAIACTEALAQATGAEIVLFHVLQPVTSSLSISAEAGIPVMVPVGSDDRMGAATAYLLGIQKDLIKKGLTVSTSVDVGPPAEQIIDYAGTNHIDLISMSSHGRTGVGRWVFGSVTDKVLHAGDTPVLVVRGRKQ